MRRFFLALLLLTAIAPITYSIVPGTATAQNGAPDRNSPIGGKPDRAEPSGNAIDPLTFYESPTFGYVIPWFEDAWQVEDEESGSDGDWWMLHRVDDVITFHGYEGDAGDPSACLDRSLEELERTAEGTIESGEDAEGNPLSYADDYQAYAIYRVVTPDGDEEQETVWHLECRRLVSGSAVLAITLAMPRDRYENFMLVEYAYLLIDSVVMPRASYDLDVHDGEPVLNGPLLNPDREFWDCYFPRNPGLLFNDAGDESGMAALVEKYDPNDQGAWHLFVLFENSGASALTIDPHAIEITASSQFGESNFAEESATPATIWWETGNGDPSQLQRSIQPGERMVVRLTFSDPFFDAVPPGPTEYVVMYDADQMPEAFLGGWRDCEGAGGRPRLG